MGSTSYTYGYTTGTNRLSGITWPSNTETIGYTATGNINSVNVNSTNSYTLTYNKANRMTNATGSGVSLAITGQTYDYAGKRITKTDSGYTPALYSYDLDGNLIEENDNGTVTDYIYVDGINVANWEPSQQHLYSIVPDQRGVALVSRDEYGLTNWAAYTQPYGAMTQTVATGAYTGPVKQNLRLPGQYYDGETTFFHNGFRDMLPGIGRYAETDLIGLGGGLNTYAYADNTPTGFIDRTGLAAGEWSERFHQGMERAEPVSTPLATLTDGFGNLINYPELSNTFDSFDSALDQSATEGGLFEGRIVCAAGETFFSEFILASQVLEQGTRLVGAATYASMAPTEDQIDTLLNIPSVQNYMTSNGLDYNYTAPVVIGTAPNKGQADKWFNQHMR